MSRTKTRPTKKFKKNMKRAPKNKRYVEGWRSEALRSPKRDLRARARAPKKKKLRLWAAARLETKEWTEVK